MSFDFKGAREHYSDKEILDGLKKEPGFRFDVDAARRKGHSDREIAAYVEGNGPAVWRASKLADFREHYPQYADLSNRELADALHAKFYADLPKADFYRQVGLADTVPRKTLRERLFGSKRGAAEDADDVEPSDEELSRASQPARMTMTRSGRRVLQPNTPPTEEAETPSAPWDEVAKSLPAQFVAGTSGAAANLRRMAAEESIAQREDALKPAQSDPSGWGALVKPSAVARQRGRLDADRTALERAEGDAAQARSDMRLVTPKDMSVAQQALSSLAQSAGPTLLGLAAGILTRNVPLAMSIAGGGGAATEAGATYGEARDEHGASHRQASIAASIDAILEGAGEALPLRIALKAGSPVLARITNTIAAEAGQEAATQFAQDLRAMTMEKPNLTLKEVWHNVKVAALAGAAGGAVYGGLGAAADASRTGPDTKVADHDLTPPPDPAEEALRKVMQADAAHAAQEADAPSGEDGGAAPPEARQPPVGDAPGIEHATTQDTPVAPQEEPLRPDGATVELPDTEPAPRALEAAVAPEDRPLAHEVVDEGATVRSPAIPQGRTDDEAIADAERVIAEFGTQGGGTSSDTGNAGSAQKALPIADSRPDTLLGNHVTKIPGNVLRYIAERGAPHVRATAQAELARRAGTEVGDAYGTMRTEAAEAISEPEGGRADRSPAASGRGGDVRSAPALPRAPLVEPIKTGALRAGFPRVENAAQAAHTLAALRRSPAERFWILALDRENQPIAVLPLHSGGIKEVRVHPEVVAQAVFQTPGAATIWFAHQHQSGTSRPSAADMELTRSLGRLFGRGTGVEVGGHVIIAGTRFSELSAAGEPLASGAIPAAARTAAIPITERTVRKAGNQPEDRTPLSSPTVAREVIAAKAAGRSGVLFLDAGNRVLDFMPMKILEMATLRTAAERGQDSRARRFFETAGRLNAAAVMVYAPGTSAEPSAIFERAANNIASAADIAGMKTLDAFYGKESLSAHGRLLAFDTFEMRAPDAARTEAAPEETDERQAAGIVMTPAYAPSAEAPAVDTKRARPDAIRQSIRDLFRVPINEGGFKKSRDVLGLYKTRPQSIRVRNQNDISVIAHELGHHLSEISRPIREARKAFDAELRQITPYAASQRGAAMQREEGMAEFVRLYLTEQAQAQAKAPGFFRAFDEYVGEHGLKSAVDAVAGAIRDWQNLPPADRILAKVGEAEPEFRKRFNLDRIIFEVFDRWLPMQRMVEDLKPDIAPRADPFKLAHLLAGDAAIIEDWLLRETVPFDFRRRADVTDRGKPLSEILKPVMEEQREFGAYLIAKRANELMRRGKEHLYSADEIAAGLRLETPEFKAAAEDIYRYQDQLLDYALEGGLLSDYVANQFRAFPFYVPFFRVGEPIGRKAATIFKEIRGGTENLRDPVANVIENTVRIIHAANRNFVLVKAHDLARTVPGGGRWLEDVPMPERTVKIETQKIIEALRAQGVEIDQDAAEALATTQMFFVKNPFGDDRERIIVIRRGGRATAIQVNDDMLWHALERFEPVDMGLIEKMLSVPADVLRAGIVLSPEFMARNFARDTLSGFIQSKTGILPVAGTIEGFNEIATRSDSARLYRAFGGAFGDMWRADRGFERTLVERMARRGGFDPRTIVTPRGLISLLHRLGSITEAGTRVAEFKHSMKDGDIDSLIEAAYRGREVSVDFGMHGHSRTVRFLTRITPFMNPALQGWYKAARTGGSAPFTTLLRGGVLTAASIALYLWNKDEEWYDEIEQWERNVYWHLDIGLRDPKDQVIPLRIPRPFEWGGFFGSIPEALTQVAIEKNGKRFARRMESIVEDVFMFRTIPPALLVPAELWANQNKFTGRPIVPESRERLASELQVTPGTSQAARKLGEAADIAPAKIDHAVRGFFGTLGTYTLMLADQAMRLAGEEEAGALPMPWQRAPVARVFFRDPGGANSRYVNEFYELLREARRADASLRSLRYTRDERMDEYLEQHREEITLKRGAEGFSRRMAALRKENERLRKDRNVPGMAKMAMILENNRQIRWLARRYMTEVEPRVRERAREQAK